jgi:hypothetical protein
MKTKTILTKAILAAGALVLSLNSASAQDNPNFAAGDLILYAHKFGGTQTLMLNVGNAATVFRNATSNLFDIKNINSELTTISGSANWYEDTNLWWGVAAVADTSTSTITPGANGDPSRTVYLSRGRNTAGIEGAASSGAPTAAANGTMTTLAGNIEPLNLRFNTGSLTMTDRLVESTAASPVDDLNQNSFNISGNPNSPYGVASVAGVMKNFGAGAFGTMAGVTAENALDLYRILATTNVLANPTPTGTARVGSYEGSFVIEQSGDISFIVNDVVPVPEPATMVAGLALGAVATLTRRRRRGQTAATAA